MKNGKEKPEVKVIPASNQTVESSGQIRQRRFLRVAAYCRVSTEDESQQTSYGIQKAFYTRMIEEHEGWMLAGIYADEAISGTSRVKRKDFNRMMDDAQSGKLDYIITKSISRFARNTVDTLNCVRQLRQLNPPVGIFFEKENIDTLDSAGELILTILSALAQDESRSISDNIRWSIQRKFQNGEEIVNLNRMIGYDRGENGEWVINAEQAEIVRYIFRRFVSGVSGNAIANELNAMGKRTVLGCIWRADAVLFILRNEKYVGDCENQKTITKNYLTHETAINRGEAPRYYVKNHHQPIIDRLTWEKVQAMLGRKRNHWESRNKTARGKKTRGAMGSPFANLSCGASGKEGMCGELLFRLGYNNRLPGYEDERSVAFQSLDPARYRERYYYYYPVWRCRKNRKRVGQKILGCTSGSVCECALEQSFMELLYVLKRDAADFGEKSMIQRLFSDACEKIRWQTGMNCGSSWRLEILDMQIRELEEAAAGKENGKALKALKEERRILIAEQDEVAALKEQFGFFMECLMGLPEINAAGMKLNVWGVDCTGDIEDGIDAAPDLLKFEKGIYLAFVEKGVVKGDIVEYETNFGVKLISGGNRRTLKNFLGFRRANPDGTVELLDECWKVSGRGVCYTRREVGEEKDSLC